MLHYTPETVDFLWQLRLNNSREWFRAHKEDYERLMNRPTRELANALFAHLQEKYPKHDWNLHISRIYRDARRLYGRGPMNDHLWFALWADREELAAPAFWFSFSPEGWDFGMGCWSQGNLVMDRFRAQLKLDPKPAEALARRLQKQEIFTLAGERYKKHRMETTPLLQSWADSKWIGFQCKRDHGDLSFSEQLFDFTRDGIDWLMPYYEYFLTLPAREESVGAEPISN